MVTLAYTYVYIEKTTDMRYAEGVGAMHGIYIYIWIS